MTPQVRIRFDCNRIPGGASTVLDPAGCGPDVATVDDELVLKQREVWVTLGATDERVPILLDLLRRHGLSWLEFWEDKYTDDDLDNARLIIMQPNRQCEIDGGVEWGITYDLSGACPACGTGGRQTSAVFVDGGDLKELEGHRAGTTYFWHLLVDERLAADLERVLPRMSPKTTGLVRTRPCKVCDRNGYFETSKAPTRIAYRASDLVDIDDANLSWENVGISRLDPNLRESLLAYPWMLVTPKVWRVFREAGVTEFDWWPVRVVDDCA